MLNKKLEATDISHILACYLYLSHMLDTMFSLLQTLLPTFFIAIIISLLINDALLQIIFLILHPLHPSSISSVWTSSPFFLPSPSFRPRAGDLVTMMLTLNWRHPTRVSVRLSVCDRGEAEAVAAADGWCKCLSYHQLWLALSGSECWVHPNHFPGTLRRSGSCVFVFVCNLSWLMCDCVFFHVSFFWVQTFSLWPYQISICTTEYKTIAGHQVDWF